jgi:hypothetical protein
MSVNGHLRNNNTVFEELEVSIVDLTRKCRFTGDPKRSQSTLLFLFRKEFDKCIYFVIYLCFQTSVYTLGEFHKNRNNSIVFEELSVLIVSLLIVMTDIYSFTHIEIVIKYSPILVTSVFDVSYVIKLISHSTLHVFLMN